MERWIGIGILTVLAASPIVFPLLDSNIFRKLGPHKITATGGELTLEPSFLIGFGLAFAGLALGAASSAFVNGSVTDALISLAFLAVAAFLVSRFRQVRVRWDADGVETRSVWWMGRPKTEKFYQIPWGSIQKLSPHAEWPERLEGPVGSYISLAFTRGRRLLVDELRARRPDLFQDAG